MRTMYTIGGAAVLIEVKDATEDEGTGGTPDQSDSVQAAKPPKPVAKARRSSAAKAPASGTPKRTSKRVGKPASGPIKIAVAGDPSSEVSRPEQPAPPAAATLTSGEVIKRSAKPTKRDITATTSRPAKPLRPAKPIQTAPSAPATIAPTAVVPAAPATAAAAMAPAQPAPAEQPARPAQTSETTVPASRPASITMPEANPAPSANKPLSMPPPTLRVIPTNSAPKRGFAARVHYAWTHTRKRRIVAVLLVLFALYNGGVYIAYRDRTYPHSTVNGQFVGNQPAKDLAANIAKLPLLPDAVTLQYKNSRQTIKPPALGMTVDAEQTSRTLLANRAWLPAYNLIRAPHGNAVISVEPKKYEQTIQQVGAQYRTKATDARIELRNNEFRLVPQIDAQAIDTAGTQAAIVEALSEGRDSAMIHLRSLSPATTTAKLQPTWRKLEAQRNTKVTLTSGNKTRQFDPAQIGSWFEPDTTINNFKLDPSRIPDTVINNSMELGITPQDEDAIATKVADAVNNLRESRIAVTGSAIGKRQYAFCTSVRGISPAELANFSTKTERTLNDKRSWSLGGNITYKLVQTGCEFTVWLTSADQMSSFGSICDSLWSCDVTPNVVINYDRWMKASEPWNKALGTGKLDEYRAMAINHEVGHELGFGHSRCQGKGKPAPVMQQQSIDLQGCVFNAWPTVQERVALKNFLRL